MERRQTSTRLDSKLPAPRARRKVLNPIPPRWFPSVHREETPKLVETVGVRDLLRGKHARRRIGTSGFARCTDRSRARPCASGRNTRTASVAEWTTGSTRTLSDVLTSAGQPACSRNAAQKVAEQSVPHFRRRLHARRAVDVCRASTADRTASRFASPTPPTSHPNGRDAGRDTSSAATSERTVAAKLEASDTADRRATPSPARRVPVERAASALATRPGRASTPARRRRGRGFPS